MAELLFELGCEEIPADDLQTLVPQLKQLSIEAFDAKRIPSSNVSTYATPRRLVLVADLPVEQKELREQKMGPPKKVAIDAKGKPTPAGEGFAKNLGVRFSDLKTIETPKGEYL
jgi:glycyl-tRNA synthetase beta chain